MRGTLTKESINMVVFMREYPIGMAGTKRIQNFLDYLLLRNVRINVISFRGQNMQPSSEGIYKSIPYIQAGYGIQMKLTHLPGIIAYYFKGFKTIYKLRGKRGSNVIYNSGGINIENFLFILWSKIIGYRLILAIEEDYSHFKDDIKPISRFKCWTIRRFDFLNCRWADAIVAISTYLESKYVKLNAKDVVLIPITANLNFNPEKKSFNEPLRILYAGTFTDKDGVGDIIEGFLKFTTYYKNVLLILTGTSSQQLKYQERYKSNGYIKFTGRVNDNEFYDLLRNADVLCMCRINSGFANAGFPFKLGEYLATGNPVICTKVSDVEQYLTDDDAYLIDPGCPDQICEALLRIKENPEQAREKGLQGMKKCKQHFSTESNGEILFKLIKKLSFPD